MNTFEIMKTMNIARKKHPEKFNTKQVVLKNLFSENSYKILGRYKKVSVNDYRTYGTLCFCDQSPLGKSRYAKDVRSGKLLPMDIQWLFLIANRRIWLGRSYKGHITVIQHSWLNNNHLTLGSKV